MSLLYCEGELAGVSRARDDLKVKLDTMVTRAAKAEQLLRVAQIEKEDLIAAYKSVCEERRR